VRACIAAAAICLGASTAWAQQPPTPEPHTTPVRIERVENGFVISPDYKLTRVGEETGQLAGVTAGYLIEDVLFVGAAGYWLVYGAPGWDLSYGGLVVGFRVPASDRVAFGVKGLAGIGTATLRTTFADLIPGRDWPLIGLPMGRGGRWHMPVVGGHSFNTGDTRVDVSQDFFVFEPQADVLFTIAPRIRFGVSGGYRVTGGADALGDRVNGATGTVYVQFGIGSR
jgi:hypothetical protein